MKRASQITTFISKVILHSHTIVHLKAAPSQDTHGTSLSCGSYIVVGKCCTCLKHYNDILQLALKQSTVCDIIHLQNDNKTNDNAAFYI